MRCLHLNPAPPPPLAPPLPVGRLSTPFNSHPLCVDAKRREWCIPPPLRRAPLLLPCVCLLLLCVRCLSSVASHERKGGEEGQ